MTKKQKGFTLVELMIVVAIIGVLAAVAIPKFADMLEKSREGATKGNLSAIKSAASNYYADQQGTYHVDLTTVGSWSLVANDPLPPFMPNYIEQLPGVKVTGKNPMNGGIAGPGKAASTASNVTTGNWYGFDSVGVGWKYDNSAGHVWVNSHLVDMAGRSYTIFGFE